MYVYIHVNMYMGALCVYTLCQRIRGIDTRQSWVITRARALETLIVQVGVLETPIIYITLYIGWSVKNRRWMQSPIL